MKMDDFNDGVDGKRALRMRKVNQEQFLTLVRMHLSFELDLNTEDNDCVAEKAKLKKWGLLSFAKKPKSTMNLQRSNDGTSLTPEGINQVKQLIEYLSKEENIVQEGIFRRTGKLTRQQDLKAALYQGVPLELDDGPYSVHDCASVLKSFLAELPEPLLTDLHYPAHCQIAELCTVDTIATESKLLSSLQLLLLLLPPINRTLLRYLLSLLNKTAAFESSNKMNCDTLATLFTPHLLCPRKLSPEALHMNSQHLSGLVAFMIRKGIELFEIPPKLATDIRAYWVEQERKLLSPTKNDLNESMSDTTGTAHTVFSFVDHKLTAKANSTQDTQAALAQLYAHIQAMPESAKKRRLVKQFNKENGQGTPRHVKHYRTKSLGDSIKKHIFQKKLLGNKKLIDINIGSNISRSSSEENILSTTRYEDVGIKKSALPSKALFSKSDDELSIDSYNNSLESENILQIKRLSNSTGSLDTPTLGSYKSKDSVQLMSFVNIREEQNDELFKSQRISEIAETSEHLENVSAASGSNIFVTSESNILMTSGSNIYTTPKNSRSSLHCTDDESSASRRELDDAKLARTTSVESLANNRISRHCSEPPDMYSSRGNRDDIDQSTKDLVRQNSDPVFVVSRRPNIEVVFTPLKTKEPSNVESNSSSVFVDTREDQSSLKNDCTSGVKNEPLSTIVHASPVVKNKFLNVYAAHTSTPSDLLRRNLANSDYMLTPITSSDKSMSPITQSTTKMSKAMQETMMTPRSRKPVMMVSGSNLCNLASLDNSFAQSTSSALHARGSTIDPTCRNNCASILEESHIPDAISSETTFLGVKQQSYLTNENKENCPNRTETVTNFTESMNDDCGTTTIQRSSKSITSTFREYLLSRSVLTASPVDLSFTSRTGDFEQSESDLNILNEEELSDSLLHCLDGNNPASDTSGIASGSTNSVNNSVERIETVITSPRKRGTSLQRHDSKRSVRSNVRVVELRQKQTLKHKQISESTLNSVKVKENVQDTSF